MGERHHRLYGHVFEWTTGVGDGQRGLACCNSWGHKEWDTTEWLNWTELKLLIGQVINLGFPGGSDSKESARKVWDVGSIPRLGRSTGKENSYPLQCSCLNNSMDRGAWQATFHAVTVRDDQATSTFPYKLLIVELNNNCPVPSPCNNCYKLQWSIFQDSYIVLPVRLLCFY